MQTFSALLPFCAEYSPVTGELPHKGQWRGALMFSLICARMNGWANNGDAGDLKRHLAHYDVIVMDQCKYHGCWCPNHCVATSSVTVLSRLKDRESFALCMERFSMMTSWNGNIFRVTGPLCGEFTGPGEFPSRRPVTRSFDVFFDRRMFKRLSKQPWGWWFETSSWSLWRHCHGDLCYHVRHDMTKWYEMLIPTDQCLSSCQHVNIMRTRWNGRHFAVSIFKLIFSYDDCFL